MGHYDAEAALDELHGLGVRVIGRIVCFLDPVLASWAWENERPEMIVLQGSGGPLETDYGPAAFTNVASPEVRQYLIDLAVEAGPTRVRRDPLRLRTPARGQTPGDVLPRSGERTRCRRRPFRRRHQHPVGRHRRLLGVSVFGIAATRPEQIAQDIRLLAPHVDYVAPMVYPSHWGPGEYDVADPNRQPADIVRASIADFHAWSPGAAPPSCRGCRTSPPVAWRTDRWRYAPRSTPPSPPAPSGFLLWNSGSFYTADALQPPVFASAD